MAEAKCRECAEGPRGIVGHDKLLLSTEERHADSVLFKCAVCSAAWLRSYEGGGVFVWSPFRQREQKRA